MCVPGRWAIARSFLIPLDELRPEDRATRYDFTHTDPAKPRTVVAVIADNIIGLATTMPSQEDAMHDYGELCALYVDPDHWNQGVGRTLIANARATLVRQGFCHALLWVLAGNNRAQQFYRNDLWIADGAERIEMKWGLEFHDVRLIRRLDNF